MPVTLTDEQAAALRAEREQWQRDKAIVQSATELWNDPSLGNDAKALWKRKWPDAEIQGFDTEQRILARLDAEKKEREEERRKAQEKAEDDEIAARRKAVKDKHGFTDDAMDRLEKLMIERKVPDYEVAATYFASQQPSPSEGEEAYDRHFWHHDRTPQFKEIAEDPEGYARKEIMRALRSDQQRARG